MQKNKFPVIVAPKVVSFVGFLSAGKYGKKNARALAIFPFIFVRKKEFATPAFINHERIHFRQQLETLFIGLFLMGIVEHIYSRLALGMKNPDVYLWRAQEQEAYRNQNNLDYLKDRKPFSVFMYVKDKKKISFRKTEGDPEIIISDF